MYSPTRYSPAWTVNSGFIYYSSEHYYPDKLTLSFAGKSKSPKALSLPASLTFAGMMRPGHDQSTNFGDLVL